MKYRHVRARQNYEHYASGRVLYGMPGYPAFPVRLASEVFQRCLAIRRRGGLSGRCALFDPCCGGAYHLCALGFLHAEDIRAVIGSDVDERALSLARRNMSLLTLDGMENRLGEISGMLSAYGKRSHLDALGSARYLRKRLASRSQLPVETRLFRADALDPGDLAQSLRGTDIDIVFADLPYGWKSEWVVADPIPLANVSFVWRLLDVLYDNIGADAVVAVAADKAQDIRHSGYCSRQHFRVGRRQIRILTKKKTTANEATIN
jgi:hypothetical protein